MNPYNVAELAQSLFEEAGDALFLFDPDTEQLLDVNPMAQRLSGFVRAELLRMTAPYLFRSEVQGGLHRLRHAFRKTGLFHSQEGFLLRHRRDGVWVPVNLTATRLHAEPKTLGLITARDLSERRAAEALVRQKDADLRRLLSTVSACVWSNERDAQGGWRSLFLSAGVEQILGRPAEFFRADPRGAWLGVVHPDDRERVARVVAELEAGGAAQADMEYRVVWPDGSARWLRDAVHVGRDGAGRVTRLDGVATDITERKAAELLLAGQNRVLEQIARGQALPVILGDLCRLIEEQTPGLRAAVHLLDDRARVLRRGAAPHLPEEYAHALHGIPAAPEAGPCGAAVAENRTVIVTDAAGEPLGAARRELAARLGLRACWALPVVAQGGGVLGACVAYPGHGRAPSPHEARVLAAAANLAAVAVERQRDADNLVASEQRFRALVENGSDIIAVLDDQCLVRFATASAARITGYALTEVVGKSGWDFVHPDDLPGLRAAWEQLLRDPRTPQTVEVRARHKQGWWLCLEGVLSNRLAHPAVRGVIVNYRDVTQRKQAEDLLRNSERRYRLLFERNLAGVFRTAPDGRVLDCNDAFAHIFGYASRDAALAGNANELYFEAADRDALLAELGRHGGVTNAEVRVRRRDGRPAWLLENVSLLADDEGGAVLEGTVVDITERHTAEQALRASEAKYRALIENLEHSVFLKDRDLRFVAANQPFCAALGVREADLLGKTDFDFYPAHLAEKYRADDLRVLHEGHHLEVEEQNLNHGRPCYVRVSKTPVKDDRGNTVGVLGIFWDVTDRRALEAQLRHAQKMEAVGQLAGGVAHDFNNLLTAVLGNTSMVLCGLAPGDPNRELLQLVEQAAQRAADLTQRLLGFSRRTVLRMEPANLNRCVEETVRLLKRTLDPRIQVETKPADGPWAVTADAGQLTQVLMNLCLNARDAMPEGGRLTLATANVTLDEADVRGRLDAPPGRYVRLTVRDTGTGIPPEIRPRIFEPFFTTKEVGKGTGLGLAMVFGIVQQHQGWVECDSVPDEGTAFHVFLPRALREVPGAKDEGKDDGVGALPAGSGTVLLVDDEAMIRNLGSRMLQTLGYTVLVAEDGLKALDVFERRGREVDLVVLDWTMPRLSGADTLRRLVELDPAVRVLFSSGYAAESALPAGFPQVVGFLNKPYRLEEMGQKVREALAKPAAAPRGRAARPQLT